MLLKHGSRVAAGVAVLVAPAWLTSATAAASDGVLERSRAAYAALRSYTDTGVILTEMQPLGAGVLKERHTFTTAYRSPRHFYFDFHKNGGTERYVIWGDGEAFHTWWSTTRTEDTYPRGQGAGAFAQGGYPTRGSALLIAPLLFAQAGLKGSLMNITEASAAGTEEVSGRRCHKLVGLEQDTYGQTGHAFNVRRLTVWVDAESLLVMKLFEDTPRGAPAGTINRVTTTFEPQANPTLDEGRFRFTAPTTQK
jgi:outer membrane lipoprotein-sorting protein